MRKYAISSWIAFVIYGLFIQMFDFLSNKIVIIILYFFYLIHLYITYRISKRSESKSVILLIPYGEKDLIGMRRFFIFLVLLSSVSLFFGMRIESQHNGVKLYFFYLTLSGLFLYDMLTFILKLNPKGRK